MRNLVTENSVTANDLIWPVFVLEGNNRKQAIKSMPGVFRLSIDLLLKRLTSLHEIGLNAVALFPVITAEKKNRISARGF